MSITMQDLANALWPQVVFRNAVRPGDWCWFHGQSFQVSSVNLMRQKIAIRFQPHLDKALFHKPGILYGAKWYHNAKTLSNDLSPGEAAWIITQVKCFDGFQEGTTREVHADWEFTGMPPTFASLARFQLGELLDQ